MKKRLNTRLISLVCVLSLVTVFGKTVDVKAEELIIEELKAEQNKDEFTIFEVTDIHYISNNINDKGEAFKKTLNRADGRETYYIEELTDAFVYEIQQKKPDLLIVSGDLTHNGEKESHIEIAKKLSKIEESGTTVLVTPGNHDINNPFAREFKGSEYIVTESITPKEFEQIYYEFGFSDAELRDKDSLSYLSKVSNDLWVLMLDTNLYEDNIDSPTTNGLLEKTTLEWVRKCGDLAKKSGVEILGVMHHNLYNHSEILYEGFTIDNNEDVLKAFKDSGINLVLSGHIHVQDIATNEEKTVYDIATSGFVVYPVTYGELTYSKEKGFTYGTKNVDVEGWATSTKNSDENLLNFSKFSKEHFYTESYKSAYRMIINSEIMSDEEEDEVKAMASTMAILNVHYFGGTVSEIDKELGTNLADTDGYKLWVANPYAFMSAYVLSMEESKYRLTTSLELTSEELKR